MRNGEINSSRGWKKRRQGTIRQFDGKVFQLKYGSQTEEGDKNDNNEVGRAVMSLLMTLVEAFC